MPDGVVDKGVTYAARKQFWAFHNRKQRWSIGVAHRKAGKTVSHVLELIKGANTCPKIRPRFAYIAPQYGQAKRIAWDYVKYYGMAISGSVPNEAELRIDFPNGGRVQLHGGDNPDALRGIDLDGVVLDEYAQMRPTLWAEIIRPALSAREGWAAFIGTPKGRNEFCKLYEAALKDETWFHFMLKASETGILPASEIEQLRNGGTMTPEQFAQEMECSFEAAILGAYYGSLMAQAQDAGRIGEVPYNPSYPVETWWDLGFGHATVIWFAQRLPTGMVHLIDFYQMTGMTLPHYVKIVKEKPYTYSRHIGPHDLKVTSWDGTGKTRLQNAADLGIEFELAPDVSIDDGINAARLLIPMCRFDAKNCGPGIEALRQYRSDFDEKMNILRPKPRQDEHTDAADAFRYGAVADPAVGDWSKPLAYRPVTTVV